MLYNVMLKGHSHLCDHADLDTSFVSFEKRLPQPPASTKITREINQKHWRANHHDIHVYLENRIFST